MFRTIYLVIYMYHGTFHGGGPAISITRVSSPESCHLVGAAAVELANIQGPERKKTTAHSTEAEYRCVLVIEKSQGSIVPAQPKPLGVAR